LGTVLFLLGLLILLSNLDLIRLRARDVWPILLILLGIAIVTRAVRTGRPALSGEYLDLSMIVGGGQFNYNAKSFRGGRITAILGGGTINLKETEMAADEAIIDALAIMGGIELIVPTEWEVVIQGTPILGGMENKSLRSGASGVAAKRLVVKGTTIMGGLEVKN
jgi:predicted membrane protein